MAKISHTKIKQPSFGEKRTKLTYTKISRFMEQYKGDLIIVLLKINLFWPWYGLKIADLASINTHSFIRPEKLL